MPGIIVHTLLGAGILDRWQSRPADAPFRTLSADFRDTFLAGCMGPDMGMLPGGELLFSDLAHYVRSGELARVLVREARTDMERAFAWGWAAHLLADVMIHPLINTLAGEVDGGGAALTFADDPGLHVAVEFGVEGHCFDRWQSLRLTPAPRLEVEDLLRRTYLLVYGPALRAQAVRTSLRAWIRWHPVAISLAATAAGRPATRGRMFNLIYRATRKLAAPLGRRSVLYALTHPLAPSLQGRARIDAALGEYPDRFAEQFQDGLRSLPDYNLDTGSVEDPVSYPLTAKTLARLGKSPGCQ